MKTVVFKIYYTMMWSTLLALSAGCGQHGHRREERKIHIDRIQEEKATADLNEAVNATDSIGWDPAGELGLFRDSIRPRLDNNKAILKELDKPINHRHRIPPHYRRRVRLLERRNEELESRLALYRIKNQAEWKDFVVLYLYDLKRLEYDIRKAQRKKIL